MLIGSITDPKDIMEKRKLKITSPRSPNHFTSAKKINEAIMHTKTLIPIMLTGFRILEKSASVAKK